MGVFDRLNFNFDSTKFGSGNDLTDGQKLYLNNQITLKDWQVGDLANSTVTGYFQNPHTANLATLTILANNIMIYANTANANVVFSDTVSQNVANLLYEAANTLYNEIPNFSAHTDRMSGVTPSANKSTTPDYSMAVQVGRQILSITNQTDSIQNNTPILGNFTSLVIGPDISNSITVLNNDLNGLNSNYYFVDPFIPKFSVKETFVQSIQSNGTLWSWGGNSFGQLGSSNTTGRSSPVQVGTENYWNQVSCGFTHTLAIQSNGTLWSWGSNNVGQLGLSDSTHRSSPVQVGNLSNWTAISAAGDSLNASRGYSMMIQSNGTLWACGYGFFGQLGVNTIVTRRSPTQVGTLSNWSKVSCMDTFTLATKTDGTLWSWGWNFYGQLGTSNLTNRSSPVQVGTLSDWSQISASSYHVLATKIDGTLWAWGDDAYGQLGLGDRTNRSSPVQVGTLSNWISISGGRTWSLAVKADNTLWAWGYNVYGQLGLSDLTDRSSPVQVGALSNWNRVCGGGYSSLFSNADGLLWSTGAQFNGVLGLNTSTTYSSPVQITGQTIQASFFGIRNSTSSASMNTFISDVQSAYILLSQRRQADTNFYTNSLSVLNDYQTLVQFNNLGATQDYLINNYIGTDKLKTDLAS